MIFPGLSSGDGDSCKWPELCSGKTYASCNLRSVQFLHITMIHVLIFLNHLKIQ